MTTHVDTLISTRWMLTVENHAVLEHHSIAITNGRITAILPTVEAKSRFNAKETYDLGHHLLMPGFINLHGHAAMTLLRGLADDLPLMTWLNEHIWPAEGQWVSPEFVADGTRLAIAEMIRSGTTTYCDNYFFPARSAEVAAELGMRARFYPTILDFPTSFAKNAEEYLQYNLQLFHQYSDHELITVGLGPHAPYTLCDESFQVLIAEAKSLGASVQIHLHESAAEIKESLSKYGCRPSERLAKLGLFDCKNVQCVHVTQVIDSDIELLRADNVYVIHCPESNLKLASGFCPVDRLQKAGTKVALGTDGAASNNDLDMIGEMRTAALLAKAVGDNAQALPAFEAVKMATLGGAQALGQSQDIGSLKVGKKADLIAIDFGQIESQPLYDPVSHLVYCTNADKVTHSWINGSAKMINRQMTRIDVDDLKMKVQRWQTKIRG